MDRKKTISPARTATAIRFDPERDGAPRVVATGQGYVADNIVRAARESGVSVERNAALAETLSSLRLGSEIPPELYNVVAQILVTLYEADSLTN